MDISMYKIIPPGAVATLRVLFCGLKAQTVPHSLWPLNIHIPSFQKQPVTNVGISQLSCVMTLSLTIMKDKNTFQRIPRLSERREEV